ncbi:MAG TPA: Rho termination factor N-terminal domain-containing protein [Solirubrobacteraceae bacterium]|nr:Rho termination factor N-terminal domain-containing protein [Solirubrobacteraceae bacterium]
MSILDRDALSASPLADLHALASELSIDGYRRLRKDDLIDAIITRQGGSPDEQESADEEDRGEDDRPAARRRRGRRGGRSRSAAPEDEADASEDAGPSEDTESEEPVEAEAKPKARTRAKPKPKEEPAEPVPEEEPAERVREEEIVEGEVELLPNGSGFLRVNPPEPSEDDVYVSAAQVKRCELVPGDRISGPRRAPRRSERFASMIRVDTINGRPADEVADSTRFDDLPAAYPSERFRLGSDDPTIKAIEWLTPFGRGSRVSIVGPSRAGKTEAVRRLAATLAGLEEIQLTLVLAGVRPEEITEWLQGPTAPVAAVSFAASADAQAQTVERAVDQARRVAARGSHAVVLIDTLDGMQPNAARKLLAAARNIDGGGSLTVIATAAAPLGGETTVIALDPVLASTGRFPALDLIASGTIRPELLVGEAGAEAIARARIEAVDR